MPRQTLRITKRNTLRRRPKQRLYVPGDISFLGRNWGKRLQAWTRGRFLALGLLGALVWLTTHFLTADQFRVAQVAVKGNRLLSVEELIQASGVRGRPILLINSEQAGEAVMMLKAVRSAKVQLTFPDKAEIEVVERPPAFVWKTQDRLYLASEDGIIIGTAGAAGGQIALVDIEGRAVNLGDQVDAEAFATARRLSELLPRELALVPAYYEYSRAEGVVLPTDFAGRVVFGNSENIDSKVATLKALRDLFREQKMAAKYVDLRFKERPYFR